MMILWEKDKNIFIYTVGERAATSILGCLPIRPSWTSGPGTQKVRMRKGYYACVLLVHPVRALKTVLLEDSLFLVVLIWLTKLAECEEANEHNAFRCLSTQVKWKTSSTIRFYLFTYFTHRPTSITKIGNFNFNIRIIEKGGSYNKYDNINYLEFYRSFRLFILSIRNVQWRIL